MFVLRLVSEAVVCYGWVGRTDAIHARVGNDSFSLATRRGFDDNDWCALQLSVSGAGQDIRCARPTHGH